MIYFTNVSPQEQHMVFIGRWSPFHRGHMAIMQSKRTEHPSLPLLIMVRDRKNEPYPATVRAEYIKRWMEENGIRGTIMIIPDIEGVYWGRDVGYNVGQIDVDEAVKQISGTKIRRGIAGSSGTWVTQVASVESASMLSPKVAAIQTRGQVIWLTGCPSSGKTTIGAAVESEIHRVYPYMRTRMLDGDDMRTSPLADHVGFSRKDRAGHIRRMAYLAKMFADCGVVVVCSFVSPDRAVRDEAKALIGANRFLEVYVKAKKQTRLLRDTKGLYKKALAGKIRNLTGYNAIYERPIHPDVICDTDVQSVEACTRSVMERMVSV